MFIFKQIIKKKVVSNLLRNWKIDPMSIGRLEVGIQ